MAQTPIGPGHESGNNAHGDNPGPACVFLGWARPRRPHRGTMTLILQQPIPIPDPVPPPGGPIPPGVDPDEPVPVEEPPPLDPIPMPGDPDQTPIRLMRSLKNAPL